MANRLWRSLLAFNHNMKIAIFHNFLDNIGGAEIVDLILAKELRADVYTTNVDQEKIRKMGFATDNIFSIGRIPVNAPFKHELAYQKFKKLDLKNKYDIYIIAGDWAMAGAIHNKPNFWYVYSPIREIWDAYDYTKKNVVPAHLRSLFSLWAGYHRYNNRRNIKHVNEVVAISKNVQARLKKYLQRDSSVIYPPTETAKFYYKTNGDFWLSVNRLFHHKRIDLQLRAFAQMPEEKLVIVGPYEQSRHFVSYVNEIKKLKPQNVEIKHWVEFTELRELYATCRGFITTSMNEDYGLTPVEAMASGKPVIAPNEGGYRETVINGQTGILIEDIDVEKIMAAVKKISANPANYKDACLKRSRDFDKEIFIQKMKAQITKVLNESK